MKETNADDTTILKMVPEGSVPSSTPTSSTPTTTTTPTPTPTTTTPGQILSWADDDEDEEDEEQKETGEQKETKETGERRNLDGAKSRLQAFSGQQGQQLHHLQSEKSFEELDLPPELYDAVTKDFEFSRPSEIQGLTIPHIKAGRNVVAQARAGSGKTLAFVIGMILRVDVSEESTQALCLAPTMEIAMQIKQDVVDRFLPRVPGLTCRTVLKGDNINRRMRIKEHIVIGTPGKVKGVIKDRALPLDNVKVFVMDEADDLISEGMLETMKEIFASLRARDTVQRLLFSATFPPHLDEVIRAFSSDAVRVMVPSNDSLLLSNVLQVYIETNTVQGGKPRVLEEIYDLLTMSQSLVFLESTRSVQEVDRFMNEAGFPVSKLFGRLETEERKTIFRGFKEGQTRVLVATDVMARGVDITDVKVVINYELPYKHGTNEPDFETYVHRVGRTGRFGSCGIVINFVDGHSDREFMRRVEAEYSPGKKMISEWHFDRIEELEEILLDKMREFERTGEAEQKD